jgi:hypothetical protein
VETMDGTEVKHVAVDSKKDGNRHSRSNKTWAFIILDVLSGYYFRLVVCIVATHNLFESFDSKVEGLIHSFPHSSSL